jgi:hypothetical protein
MDKFPAWFPVVSYYVDQYVPFFVQFKKSTMSDVVIVMDETQEIGTISLSGDKAFLSLAYQGQVIFNKFDLF